MSLLCLGPAIYTTYFTLPQGTAAQVLAALNNSVLMLMDHLGVTNVKAQMREFAAQPLAAVALLLRAL